MKSSISCKTWTNHEYNFFIQLQRKPDYKIAHAQLQNNSKKLMHFLPYHTTYHP